MIVTKFGRLLLSPAFSRNLAIRASPSSFSLLPQPPLRSSPPHARLFGSSSSPPPSRRLPPAKPLSPLPHSQSELRLVFGAYSPHPVLSFCPGVDPPKRLGMRLKFGAASLQARVGSVAAAGGGTSPDSDDVLLVPPSGDWSEFALRCAVPPSPSSASPSPPASSFVELQLVDLDSSKTFALAYVPMSTFSHEDLRRGPCRASSRVSRGQFKASLLCASSSRPVGEAFGEYMLCHPFSNPRDSGAPPPSQPPSLPDLFFSRPPFRGPTLDVGHRGSGRSYRPVPRQVMASVRENTIASFKRAGEAGADFVELDVVLTKDRVPVVFHDFDIGVKGRTLARRAKEKGLGKGGHSLHVLIAQLTLAELESLMVLGTDTEEFVIDQHLVHGEKDKAAEVSKSSRGGDNAEGLDTLDLKIPTLAETLTHLPPHLGLNIEIKYPINNYIEWLSFHPSFEINSYLDDILEVVFAHAGPSNAPLSRPMVFSCFSPDVCTALTLKQSRVPVLFLTGDVASDLSDCRCTTYDAAIKFAKGGGLAGIVCNSEVVFGGEGGQRKVEGKGVIAEVGAGTEGGDGDDEVDTPKGEGGEEKVLEAGRFEKKEERDKNGCANVATDGFRLGQDRLDNINIDLENSKGQHTEILNHEGDVGVIQRAKEEGLVLWSWGDLNSHEIYVERQRELGIGAVICDNIQTLVDKKKRSRKNDA